MLRLLPVFRQSLEIILHPAELHFTQRAFESWVEGHLFQPSDWFVTFERLKISRHSCIILCLTLFWQVSSPCLFFAGWLHRFHGVCGRAQSGDARKDGAQAALVFQTLWCGWKRLHWPTWAPQHHKGTKYRWWACCNTECYRRPPASRWDTDFVLFLQAIRAINGSESQDITAEDFTNRVFDRIDINGDGECLLAPRIRKKSICGWAVFRRSSAPVLSGNTTGLTQR